VAVDGLFLANTPVASTALLDPPTWTPSAVAGLAAGVPYDDSWALWRDGERCVAALEDP
jgi:hypothetical protein